MFPWTKDLTIARKNDVFQSLRTLCCICLLVCLPHAGRAENVEINQRGKFSISVQDTELSEVFEMLSREGNVNILLGNGVSGDISVNLYEVSLEKSIRTIATAAGFAVEYIDGSYFIMPHDNAGKDHASGITELKTFKVQYSDPEQIEGILSKHLSRYGKITALPERRLLVVEELPDFLDRIEQLLLELDRQPKQILIEAKILEITLDKTETFGIDWSRIFKLSKGGKDQLDGSLGTRQLGSPNTPGFFTSLVNPHITIVLDALDKKGRVRTLSTPKLLALEHEEAEVIIGDRTGYQVTTTINQVTTESIAFLESGVILRIESFVDNSGRIRMQIHPEVSTATVTNGIPSLKTTEVTTNFLAEDGQTIFIAGLLKNSTSNRREGVPVLSDIPLIGKAFGNSEEILLNTETIVMITPHIVEAGDDLFMMETSSKVDKAEHELEHDKQKKIIEKIERKIGPIEFIESLNDPALGDSHSDQKTNSSQNIADIEYDLKKCKNLPTNSIHAAMNQECNRSRSSDDNKGIEILNVFKSLLMFGSFL